MKKLITYFVVLISILGLYACLDDKGYSDITKSVGSKPVVSLFGTQNGRYAVAVEISAAEPFAINIAVGGATTDLTVTFKEDGQVAVDNYNATLLTEYIAAQKAAGIVLGDGSGDPAGFVPFILLLPSLYTIPSKDVIVKKGVVSADLNLLFNSAAMSLTAKYCLPLSIASVSGDSKAVISSNLSTVLMGVQLKNKYDGLYTVTGTMVDATNSALTGFYPWKVALVTNGASQVIMYDNDAGFAIRHLILSSGGLAAYGSFGVVMNFNPTTNAVTSVVNFFGQPSGNGRSGELDPSGVNIWDPATKTLKVKYWMNQPGTTHRTSFNETITYTGVR